MKKFLTFISALTRFKPKTHRASAATLALPLPLEYTVIRMATAQGKQGIWFLLFPDRENTGNFVLTQGKIC